MVQKILHKPRLDTIVMVEQTIEKYSGEFGKFQLWRKLPRSAMYQTYLVILDYLEHSNKIAFDRTGKVAWIFSEELYRKYVNKKHLAWKSDGRRKD